MVVGNMRQYQSFVCYTYPDGSPKIIKYHALIKLNISFCFLVVVIVTIIIIISPWLINLYLID